MPSKLNGTMSATSTHLLPAWTGTAQLVHKLAPFIAGNNAQKFDSSTAGALLMAGACLMVEGLHSR